jgi:hypothetical protein
MSWIKSRNAVSSTDHCIFDTVRGSDLMLKSNSTAGQANQGAGCWSANSTGFTINNGFQPNFSTDTYVSWTFRKAQKFFDIVTYTGDGTTGRALSHNLGTAPGMYIVKRTDSTGDWSVYHRSRGAGEVGYLHLTNAFAATGAWNSTEPTASQFTVSGTGTNASGATYIAYLFAHDTGTDGLIQCGSFTTDGSGNATVTLGWEPQYVMVKSAVGSTGGWQILDTVRSYPNGSADALLQAQSTAAESSSTDYGHPTATGFVNSGLVGSVTYVYMAIRRGPMRQPTTGTQVYSGVLTSSPSFPVTVTAGFPVDVVFNARRTTDIPVLGSRLTDRVMGTYTTVDETSFGSINWDYASMTGFTIPSGWGGSGDMMTHCLRRYPGVLDVVCYTGTGTAHTESHNLKAVPELIIVKNRGTSSSWYVWHSSFAVTDTIFLEQNNPASNGSPYFNDTAPTSSVFSVDSSANTSSNTYVAYLFATLAGISKVGSYTGTGTTLQVNCGFSAGARFLLIKRTDAPNTGDWYLWDSTRGIIAGNDPYFLINTTDAETTGTDYIDPYSAGFELSSTAPVALNANGGTYIFLAFA